MAIQKLIICLTSLVVLTSSKPQALLNTKFGYSPVPKMEFLHRPFSPDLIPNPSVPLTPAMPTFASNKPVGAEIVHRPQPRLLLTRKPAMPEVREPRVAAPNITAPLSRDGLNESDIVSEPQVQHSNSSIFAVTNKAESLYQKMLSNLMYASNINNVVPTGVALLGAALGREGCFMKALCLAGSLVPPVWRRDMIVAAVETILPPSWVIYFEAAKHTITSRSKDCNPYLCF